MIDTLQCVPIFVSILLYFFATEFLWKNRNYFPWLIVIISIDAVFYFILPFKSRELALIMLSAVFAWWTFSLLLDIAFLAICRKPIKLTAATDINDSDHLIFTTITMTGRYSYNKKNKRIPNNLDISFSVFLILCILGTLGIITSLI